MKTLAHEARQIARLETEISSGESRIKARDLELASEALYQDYAKWNVLNAERETWVKAQGELTAQWASLCEEAEKLRTKLKELESA